MKFQGALIREQNVTFAIVIVKEHILQGSSQTKDETLRSFQPLFPGVPVTLMAQNHHGIPTYYGRPDIVNFLSNVSIDRIPWKEYTYN